MTEGGVVAPSRSGRVVRPQPGPQPGAQPAQQPGQEGGQPAGEAQPEGEKKEEEKPKEGESAGAQAVTRPDKPSVAPDPRELKIEPDEDGNVRFSFHGQPWLDVLNWLAVVSGLSLDWQELPGDYLNLTTHREYSLAETRDLLNRHLLSRGYTMIVEGEVLHVVKMEKLDPAMVQHVPPAELDKLLPSTVVKTTFELPKDLPAEQAVEDVKQLLSVHGKGKVQALKATNRIFAIDTAANLLDVQRMLVATKQQLEGHTVPRTFLLQYARATDVVKTLQELLGMAASGPAMPMDPNQMQQMMQQQMQQMQQQMQQQQQQGGGGGAPKSDKVYLVAVPRHNVILANAPPDKMEIIEKAIEVLDVEMQAGESLLGNMHRVSQYRLVSLDPEVVVNTLQEIGNLDPRTRLQADKKTRTLVAYATLADHVTIRSLIEKLDGSGRSFHVIRLRRLPADQVAGTIEYMMGGKKEDESASNRRSYSSIFYGYYGRQQEEEPPKDSFRVEADLERNRLMLWATVSELKEVNDFIYKMGEMPAGAAELQTVRVVEASGRAETDALLERLQNLWGGRNELIIQDNRPAEQPQPAPEATKREDVLLPPEDRQTSTPPTRQGVMRFAQLGDFEAAVREAHEAISGDPSDDEAFDGAADDGDLGDAARAEAYERQFAEQAAQPSREQRPPLRITVTPDGRMILNSDDPAALDLLEEMILDLTPPPQEFKVFYLKNVDAFWVAYDLKDFFKEEIDEKENTNVPYWYRYDFGNDNKDRASRLSRRRKLTFVANTEANAIIVRGATPEQLRVIDELIRVFDKPPNQENVSARRVEIVRVQFSSARVIAEAIKEAYRDLLSSKDKAFQNQQQQEGERGNGERELVRIYDYGSTPDDAKKPTPVKVSFEGALSLGVDEVSNTLIISAQEELIGNIVLIAKYLDEQAKPNSTVRVHRVQNVDTKSLHGMLAKTLVDPWVGGKRPPQPGEAQPQNGEGQQPNGEGQGPQQPGQNNGRGGGAVATFAQ